MIPASECNFIGVKIVSSFVVRTQSCPVKPSGIVDRFYARGKLFLVATQALGLCNSINSLTADLKVLNKCLRTDVPIAVNLSGDQAYVE